MPVERIELSFSDYETNVLTTILNGQCNNKIIIFVFLLKNEFKNKYNINNYL